MTAAGIRKQPGVGTRSRQCRAQPRARLPRLVLLHLLSRRAPVALAVLGVTAGVLRLALDLHWVARSGAGAQQVPLVVVAAAAAVIAASTRSPFGDPERATGH